MATARLRFLRGRTCAVRSVGDVRPHAELSTRTGACAPRSRLTRERTCATGCEDVSRIAVSSSFACCSRSARSSLASRVLSSISISCLKSSSRTACHTFASRCSCSASRSERAACASDLSASMISSRSRTSSSVAASCACTLPSAAPADISVGCAEGSPPCAVGGGGGGRGSGRSGEVDSCDVAARSLRCCCCCSCCCSAAASSSSAS
mmetsp:Transcript_2932/g.7717  ORF Transcript_2932/g.7717 Transcript_2932/m.7717 type:complete len:208 (+) Transcript_2932:320-943(+)